MQSDAGSHPFVSTLLSDNVHQYVAKLRIRTVLEYIKSLPGAERELPVTHWNGKLRGCKSCANMGWHIVAAFGGVPEPGRALRDQPLEKFAEVALHIRIGVLLNDERCRRVLDKNRTKPGLYVLSADPFSDLVRDFVQALGSGSNLQVALGLLHSTVTLLARLRG